MEEDIIELLEVTATKGDPTEGYVSIGPFGLKIFVIIPTRRPTTITTCVINGLRLVLTSLFITVDIFALVIILIYSYVCCLLWQQYRS